MVIRQVMEVVNNQVTITLPKLAADDPLFLADLQAVQEDFSIIDNEQP